jgi:DNA-binding GntR family transcriptional regulator
MVNELQDQIYRFRKLILSMNNMARISNDDHRKMLEAIRERDVSRVERLVSEHILRGQRIVLQALEKRPGDF